MSPFVDQNKAVLAAEYPDTGARLSRFCPKAGSLRFDAILKKRNLGAWRQSCWPRATGGQPPPFRYEAGASENPVHGPGSHENAGSPASQRRAWRLTADG